MIVLSDDIREAGMVIYHRWRALQMSHDAALRQARRFEQRCRRLAHVPPCLPLVAAEIENTGKTPREINARMPDATRCAVNEALLILVRSGRATFEGEMGNRRYRLASAAISQPDRG